MYNVNIILFVIVSTYHQAWIEAVELLTLIRNKPYSSIWNVPSHVCEEKYGIQLNTSFFDIDTNKQDEFIGDHIVLFYRNRLGLYPYIDSDGSYVNGGLPQLADLNQHLNYTEGDIEYYIPMANFTGLAVIDWEDWRPVYHRNNFNSKQRRYITASEQLVHQMHPEWPTDKVKKIADMEFTIAARSFMETTLLYGRTLRAGGFWGFYGFPNCYNHELGENTCSESTKTMNDELWWLFNTSSALVPSIYLAKSFGNYTDRLLFVQGQLSETRRVHKKYSSNRAPMLPYTEFYYRDSNELYDIEDLRNSIEQSAYAGLNGVVIWGSSRYFQTREDCVRVRDYVQTTLGPFVKNLTDFMSNCSDALCNSHGRCVSTKWLDSDKQRHNKVYKWLHIFHTILTNIFEFLYIDFEYKAFYCECDNNWYGKFCQNGRL